MPPIQSLHRWVGLGVFVVVLGLYTRTMAPGLTFWDCGEFITCSYILGVPHPPGSPLYVLLGRIFTLLPFADVAWRVVFMSVLASALSVWCVYLSTVALARRALGGASLQPFDDGREISVVLGAAVSALVLACSYTMWFNATEAEVYGYSIFFVCLGVWLVLYWEGTQHGGGNDKWLFLIAYVFGLGGGLHLLCLLIIPSILILAWFADEKLRRPIVLILAVGVWAFASLLLLGPGTGSNLSTLAALAVLLYYLYRHDRRSCWLLLGVAILFALGYSTYAALYIRSGLEPAVDQNNPETWAAFVKFLNREQYGSESQLLGMLQARATRTYQFWHLQMKYFFQQFPFPLLERTVEFRRATENARDVVSVSLIPYLLGVAGLLWHGRRDWKRFLAVLSMFLIMGFGLSLYLNMLDPQPRERHYVFGGMYFAFALWIGLGWIAIVEGLRLRFALRGALLWALACAGLALPAGIGAKLYHIEDRTGDFVAHDYAYNILQTCEPNGLLFTNGDNDTFPLWYLQEVEGVRRDVRVINLSLLNTNWYIKQLRDREPKVPIRLDDTYIDSVLTDTQLVDLYRRAWREPVISQVKKALSDAGFDVDVKPAGSGDLLRVQDLMIIGLLLWNNWERPIYFAITVASSGRLGLDPYLRMQGMALKLVKERDQGPDVEALEHNLFEVYRFRNLTDPEVYKDFNTQRLLANYRACVLQLADIYQREGRNAEVAKLMLWAEERLFFNWEGYYTAADYLKDSGRIETAGNFIAKAGSLLLDSYGEGPHATYENVVTLAGILLNPPHSSFDQAEDLYLRAMAREPHRWEAYYELAATLQAKGDAAAGLALLVEYREEYGEVKELVEAERVLGNALNRRQEAKEGEVSSPESSAAQP